MKPARPDSSNDFASSQIAFAQSSIGHALLKALADGSASQRAIADYLLRNQLRVTALGIEELAAMCQVSTATVSRFARDIGYANYSAMRSEVAETLQSVQQPVDKLRASIARGKSGTAPAFDSLACAVANIGASGDALDAAEVARVVSLLTRARAVYVMGFGLSSHLAGLLAMHLQPFCQQVIEVAGHGGTEVAAANLANITAKDVLVILSFPRYALDVVRLGSFARELGASIVAITDSPASPLAGLGNHVLYAPSGHPILPSSSGAAIAVIEALVASLMVSNKANVAKASRLTEAISAYLVGASQDSKSSSTKDGPRRRIRNDNKT
ncbi:MurR/RpiR family transcriptional regulator [Massilia glaciei]|uniref:MurR/RpiR family transcriptional regulator n=1 Tax=Massilia glaciei TaxID=1524097 RepID=A0A2U2H9T1_9BURK|nr:MurR/RpiR family transcriptional regulator [Massilia glaciei]PWF39396.1 MurR/RpiR family transcriptional regulator [Massilia glaciei]